MRKKNSYQRKREENMMTWAGYWRENPHKFAEDYLGMSLYLYQKLILFMMNKVSIFMYIAARGSGKV